jgi:hypothetical protein
VWREAGKLGEGPVSLAHPRIAVLHHVGRVDHSQVVLEAVEEAVAVEAAVLAVLAVLLHLPQRLRGGLLQHYGKQPHYHHRWVGDWPHGGCWAGYLALFRLPGDDLRLFCFV